MSYLWGQIFGIAATVLSIVMPFYKKKWMMLINTAMINIMAALNVVLIGKIGPAVFLCVVAAIQSMTSLWHTVKEEESSRTETILFPVLYLVLGFFGYFSAPGFRWELSTRNFLELLPILGSLASMAFVFIRNERRARRFLLATCIIWAIYTGAIGATTFFAQIFSVGTTIAAMLKYRKKPTG